MAGFEYGNTRLRAMKSRLISRPQMTRLVEAGSLENFISELARTDYRRDVEAVLARSSGMVGVPAILRRNYGATVGRISHFYNGKAALWVNLLFWRCDLQNLKAVLRGLAGQFPAPEILEALQPVGNFSQGLLERLAQSANLRTAIDLLATLRIPFSRPLLELRGSRPAAEVPEMETALERWYFKQVSSQLKENHRAARMVKQALRIEADVQNLMTIFRIVQAAEIYHQPVVEIQAQLVPPGNIQMDVLERTAHTESIEAAVSELQHTPYAALLLDGLQAYRQFGTLSEFEKRLKHYNLRWRAVQLVKDPLGIGVPLGFLALKENEYQNLRRVALYTYLGFSSAEILLSIEELL